VDFLPFFFFFFFPFVPFFADVTVVFFASGDTDFTFLVVDGLPVAFDVDLPGLSGLAGLVLTFLTIVAGFSIVTVVAFPLPPLTEMVGA
jgi:hypothetical protein